MCILTNCFQIVKLKIDRCGYYGHDSYDSSPTETGYYEYKHIYDMAGNVKEWTMEADGVDCRVVRGGSYFNDGKIWPASARESASVDSKDCTFRISNYSLFK